MSFLQENEDDDSLDVFSFDPNTSDPDISNDVDMSFLERDEELDIVGLKKETKKENVAGSFIQVNLSSKHEFKYFLLDERAN